jgi:hypothetical protein
MSEGGSHAARRQLTLFLAPDEAAPIDALRRQLDPVQAGLIAAHITLAREDEFDAADVAQLPQRLAAWTGGAVDLQFGPPQRLDGHGLLLPCVGGAAVFQALRQCLLGGRRVRPHQAHLTLAHPRNPRAPGNDDQALLRCPSALRLRLDSVALIEQQGGQAWQCLARWTLSLCCGASLQGAPHAGLDL